MLLTIPFAVVLSVMIGVNGCGCFISSRAVQSSSPFSAFAYSAPILDSAAKAMTFLISLQMLWTGTFKGTLVSLRFLGLVGLAPRKKYPPALLLACSAFKYEALVWIRRVMPLA
eukprot:11689114-Ditylum_brightwellii.AAC.1